MSLVGLLALEILFLLNGMNLISIPLMDQVFETSTASSVGKIVFTEQSVRRRRDGSLSWYPIAENASVYLRDTILTGPQSQVRVALGSGVHIELSEDSLIYLSPSLPAFQSQIFQIEMLRGKVAVRAQRPTSLRVGNQMIELKGPSMLSISKKSANDKPEIFVKSGVVKWLDSQARELASLAEGSRSVLLDNQTIAPVVVPVPPPEAQLQKDTAHEATEKALPREWGTLEFALHTGIKSRYSYLGKAVEFRWLEISGAESYEIEISKNPDFKMSQTFKTAKNVLKWSPSQEGKFFCRVRAFDPERGLSAPSTVSQLQIRSRLEPPKAKKGKIRREKHSMLERFLPWAPWFTAFRLVQNAMAEASALTLELEWEQVKGALGYVVEIAEDPKFERKLGEWETQSELLIARVPELPKYYWRVASKDSQGVLGFFSSVNEMSVDSEDPKPIVQVKTPVQPSPQSTNPFIAKDLGAGIGMQYQFSKMTEVGLDLSAKGLALGPLLLSLNGTKGMDSWRIQGWYQMIRWDADQNSFQSRLEIRRFGGLIRYGLSRALGSRPLLLGVSAGQEADWMRRSGSQVEAPSFLHFALRIGTQWQLNDDELYPFSVGVDLVGSAVTRAKGVGVCLLVEKTFRPLMTGLSPKISWESFSQFARSEGHNLLQISNTVLVSLAANL